MGRRFFETLIARRRLSLLAVLAFSAACAVLAAIRVRPDFSVEYLFPEHDRSRFVYDRYKDHFPYEPARALCVVEAPDLFAPAGLARVAALEHDLAHIEGVIDTDGLTTVRDVVSYDAGDGESGISTARLFPRADLGPAAIAEKRRVATEDPLFRWTLCPPDGRATTIRVTLRRAYAEKDATRMRFLKDARAVIARHEREGQRIILSGLPVIRAEFTELILIDTVTLMPIAMGVILVLLYLAFRSAAPVLAALFTIGASVLWMLGAAAVLGLPLQLLTQLTPIVCMIVSISDTVHIVERYQESLAEGSPRPAAIVDACADNAGPCLLTEIVIAFGFAGLVLQDVKLTSQFGLLTAIGMLLVWAANMTVLPLALSYLPPGRAAASPGTAPVVRALRGFLAWVDRVGRAHPTRVVAAAVAILGGALILGKNVGREYYAYGNLYPDSRLARSIRYLDSVHGGSVPLAVLVEPGASDGDGAPSPEEPMLEPGAVALVDRIAAFLEASFPEVKQAGSGADYWRKVHRLWVGDEEAARAPLPGSRGAVAQELELIDRKLLRDFLSADRSRAAVFAMVPDLGSSRSTRILDDLAPYLALEEARTGYRITPTGAFAICDGIYRTMVSGLAASLGFALLLSLGVFTAVLRSWRLGLVALVPNVLPLILTLGIMALLGIDLDPTTVICFSITLVIADDDTIQFIVRYRRRYLERQAQGGAAAEDLHDAVASETVDASGVPMLLTACAVSAGFLALGFSQFLAVRNLGILIGVSLFTAVFADLFLTPILLRVFRPRIGD